MAVTNILTLNLLPGGTHNLGVAFENLFGASESAPGTTTYLSDAPNIASVNNTGMITANQVGVCQVTVFNNYGYGTVPYQDPEPIGYVKITVQQNAFTTIIPSLA